LAQTSPDWPSGTSWPASSSSLMSVPGRGRPVVPENSWMDAGLNDSTGLVSDRP
jgi:hypothetical protein